MPYSALKAFVTTRNSWIPSTPRVFPEDAVATVLPEKEFNRAPSRVELLDASGAPLLLKRVPSILPPPVAMRLVWTPGWSSARST